MTLSTNTSTHLKNPLYRRLLQIVCFSLIVVLVSGHFSGLPALFLLIRDSALWGGGYQAALTTLGISHTFFASYALFFEAVMVGLTVAMAAFIGWQRRNDWVALVASVALVAVATSLSLAAANTPLPLQSFPQIVSLCCLVLLWVFPNGRFVPRWTRWLVIPHWALAPMIGSGIAEILSSRSTVLDINAPLFFLYFTVFMGIALGSQIYRYSHVSTPQERQQTKLFMVGLLILFIVNGSYLTLQLVIPSLRAPLLFGAQAAYGVPSLLFTLFTIPIIYLGMLSLPLGLTFSMLRYRLWDADIMLNRSLVYGIAFSGIVLFFGIGLYTRFVIFSQTFGSQETLLLMVITVLISIVIIIPLRKFIQNQIDRHVFGLRFDLNQLHRAHRPTTVTNPGFYTGRVLGGYQLQEVIGRGGMGEVYRGIAHGKEAAIKVMPPHFVGNPEFRARLEREAQTMRRLQHPNIVQFYDYGTVEDVAYLAMEYIQGQELKDWLKEHGRLSLEEVREVLRGLSAALDHAHQQGVVHRDLKPSNVMLRRTAELESIEAVLMDFGIVHLKDATSVLTGTGLVGTIDYMSPEQIQASQDINHEVDIYALGVLLFEMLTGEKPFKGTPAQILFAHLQQPPPYPSDFIPELPASIDQVILQALAKQPAERPPTAGSLFVEWQQALTANHALIS